VGGARGGGSELTPLGQTLLARFRQLRSLTEGAADTMFQDVFVDGLLEQPGKPEPLG